MVLPGPLSCLNGKQLLNGMSRWKPVPTPAISEGKSALSGSCIKVFKEYRIFKHMGWCARTSQLGVMPDEIKIVPDLVEREQGPLL